MAVNVVAEHEILVVVNDPILLDLMTLKLVPLKCLIDQQ
jgi:hypothetical protein